MKRDRSVAIPDDSTPRAELVARWRKLYGRSPPRRASHALLVQAVAYAEQARAFGGLSTRTRRKLNAPATPASPKLSPGARLIREWYGVTHVVEVTERGVLWRGREYTSLTAVAHAITGAKWSGPRFFGLRSKRAP